MSKEVVKDDYITNEYKRNASFNTRKANIIKKVSELSILCGVEAGAIIFSGDPSNPTPEVWPDHEGVQQLIERCHARPVSRRTLTIEEPIQQRINIARELLMRKRQENDVEEISQQMIQCLAGKAMPNPTNWNDMKMLVEQTLKNNGNIK
ncbi:hypothetical protein K1719_004535 [Acacia pycnantha]|nr:hypothetical protein K1719_004535 [Acacia pycnantha]